MGFRSYRNLADDTVRLAAGLNLVLGDNGQGKSNLLEAAAVLGTLRSFRTASLRSCVRHGCTGAAVSGEVGGARGRSRIEVHLRAGQTLERRQLVDGRSCPVERYLGVLPLTVLTGWREDLVAGGPQVRRSFLDRLAFQLKPSTLGELRRYRAALAQRNAALRDRRSAREVAAWEPALARAAAEVVWTRRWALELLRPVVRQAFADVAACRVEGLELAYRGESWLPEGADPGELAEIYEKRYASARERDGRLGFTGIGPHRHDLSLAVDGRPAREALSSGQAKLVAATLRLAALEAVEGDGGRDDPAPVVMDDADAELDREAFRVLLRRVGRDRQVLVSSPRGEEIQREIQPDAVIWLRGGRVLRGLDVETTHDESVHS